MLDISTKRWGSIWPTLIHFGILSLFFEESRSNTTIRSNFFTQRVIDDWNQLPSTIRESQNIKIFKRNLDQYLSSSEMNWWTENMTGSPEEDCVEKMLLNAPSGGYINYSPSIQVYLISSHHLFIEWHVRFTTVPFNPVSENKYHLILCLQ